MLPNPQIYPDRDTLMQAISEETVRIANAALDERDRFALCLSGGHTPAALYALWAERYREQIPWERTHIFFGDERYVPPEDSLSNYRMARETLISRVPIPAANVHPMATNVPSADDAARQYEFTLREFFGSAAPSFDLEFLGVGPEGHTASLFPGSPSLDEKVRWVLAAEVPAQPPHRLTLTLLVLNQARNVFFIADGAGKQEIIQALRNEPDSQPSQYPAGRIRPKSGHVIWFLDQAASGQ
jgi:6-phosphogluconolactonase